MQSSSAVGASSKNQDHTVRVVQKTEDPYQGLKGHAYIAARNLSPHVTRRVQTSAQQVPSAPREVSK
jgi:hypothetical protein